MQTCMDIDEMRHGVEDGEEDYGYTTHFVQVDVIIERKDAC